MAQELINDFFLFLRCNVSGYTIIHRGNSNVSQNTSILQQKFKISFLPTGFRSGGGEDQSDEGTAQEVIRKVIAMTRERHSKEERASGQADRKDSEEIGPGPIDPGKKRPTFSFWGGGWFVGPIHRLPLRSTVVVSLVFA